ETASGGLRRGAHLRGRRSGPQSLTASGENRLRYDRARRGALLPQNNLLKNLVCSLPTIGGGGGIDAYDAVGGSVSGGISFNPRNGQISVGLGLGVGVGIGGGAYGKFGGGPNGGVGAGGSAPLPFASGGVVVNAAAELGLGVGVSRQLLGTSPGDWGATVARAGPDATANANVGVAGNLNAPALYNLGCK
ncbi:MAG: hypothetical protein P4M09_31090, partial [Devosia sp.]|nr:hypothetical protein [Devosia sp.]